MRDGGKIRTPGINSNPEYQPYKWWRVSSKSHKCHTQKAWCEGFELIRGACIAPFPNKGLPKILWDVANFCQKGLPKIVALDRKWALLWTNHDISRFISVHKIVDKVPPIHRPSKKIFSWLHFTTTCEMKYDFLLVWGIFRKFPVQAKLSFFQYACCVHTRGGRESFLF